MIKLNTSISSVATAVLILLYSSYLFYGIMPLASPFDADATSMCNTISSELPWSVIVDNGYRFEIKPLLFLILRQIHKFADCRSSYMVLSYMSAIITLISTVVLGTRLGLNSLLTLGCSLLFQEYWAAGLYENETVIALSLILVAILLPSKRGMGILAGTLVGCAAGIRFDAIFGIPLLLFRPLLIKREIDSSSHTVTVYWRSLQQSAVPIFCALIVVITEYLILGSGLSRILTSASHHATYALRADIGRILFVYFTCFSWIFVLFGIYAASASIGKNPALLLLGWLIVVFAYYVDKITTPEYIIYALPPLALFATAGAHFLGSFISEGRASAAALALVIVSLLTPGALIGQKASMPNWITKKEIPLFSGISFSARRTTSTDGRFRLTSGGLLLPAITHDYRAAQVNYQNQLLDFIDRHTLSCIVPGEGWVVTGAINYYLYGKGFKINAVKTLLGWTEFLKDQLTVRVKNEIVPTAMLSRLSKEELQTASCSEENTLFITYDDYVKPLQFVLLNGTPLPERELLNTSNR